MDPNKVLQEQSVIAQRMHEETGALIIKVPLPGWKDGSLADQVLRRPVHACGIEGKTVCGLAIENNHTESDPILRGPLYKSVTCQACMARSRKAEEGS